jgi:hypothetical protein
MVRRFEQTLADIDKRCRAHQISYTIIGGIAVIIHGYLRARAKEFVAVERSDVPERLEELLAATKSRRKK